MRKNFIVIPLAPSSSVTLFQTVLDSRVASDSEHDAVSNDARGRKTKFASSTASREFRGAASTAAKTPICMPRLPHLRYPSVCLGFGIRVIDK